MSKKEVDEFVEKAMAVADHRKWDVFVPDKWDSPNGGILIGTKEFLCDILETGVSGYIVEYIPDNVRSISKEL